MFSLTVYPLRLTACVKKTIEFGPSAGSALRGALASYLQKVSCSHQSYQAGCTACELLAGKSQNCDVRRPYTITPPLAPQRVFEAGETFDFGVTLFGEASRLLPHVILAWHRLGKEVGLRGGYFELKSVDGVNPLRGQSVALCRTGWETIRLPSVAVEVQDICQASGWLLGQMRNNQLNVEFLTPTRLLAQKKLVRHENFSQFFARLYERVESLHLQHGTFFKSTREKKSRLLALANTVQTVHNESYWHEVEGYSRRMGRTQPLGGLLGLVRYQVDARVWSELMPYLVYGTLTQVGKNTAKGSGVFRISL